MFKISQSATFWWPVVVDIPVDNGKYKKETFDCQFVRKSQKELLDTRERIMRGEINDVDLAREIVVGWRGLLDDNGQEFPYSEANRDVVFDVALVTAAIINAYTGAMEGPARRKN